jgi:adenylate cyclase
MESLIEAMDRPLLILAVVSMLLYLIDLRGLMGWAHAAYVALTFLIDLVFVFDLVLKLRVYGGQYVQTPWFLIDFLSCLPVLDVLANNVFSFRSIRFIRGFRILRILRGLRVLRVLRALPAFERLMNESPSQPSRRSFHRAMNLGMVVMTLAVLGIIVWDRKEMENQYREEVDAVTRDDSSPAYLRSIGGSFKRPEHTNYLARTVQVAGHPRQVYFDLQNIEDRSNRSEFILILGMMLTMVFFLYIMGYHQLDVTQAHLRALLNLALPRQVAERFVLDPSAYEQKSRTSAAIVFMDFVGFTRTCELLSHDPDTLSAHLEAAMDRLVRELVEHDLIIDKFIGDAIMSFRGGPLVTGDLAEHSYRAVRASLDSIKALADLKDPYFSRVKIGGASADDCLIGAFGTSARLTYTILGDGVNLAARLEPASAQCATQNLFCERTYQLCADRPDIVWRRWGRIRVHGKSGPIDVFEAFDTDDLGDPTFVTTFAHGLDAFERCDFPSARDLFLTADRQRDGGDEPSRDYAHWCETLLHGGLPIGWEPVFDTQQVIDMRAIRSGCRPESSRPFSRPARSRVQRRRHEPMPARRVFIFL